MKVDYSFTTGEKTEIEVSEEWGNLLLELDRQEHNNNQTESRRHASLDAMEYEGEFFVDLCADLVEATEKEDMRATLLQAIDGLLPQQQELIKKVFFENRSIIFVAREEGVGESAIRDRLNRIEKKLQKYLK